MFEGMCFGMLVWCFILMLAAHSTMAKAAFLISGSILLGALTIASKIKMKD